MNKIKILFIYQFLTFGGVETLLKNRFIYLLNNNIQIDLLCLYNLGGGKLYDKKNGFNIYIMNNLNIIKRFIEDNNYKYIISLDTPQVHNIIENLNINSTVILEIHTGYYENREYVRKKFIPKNTKLIIVPSQSFKKIIKKELDNINIPIFAILNPVNKLFFNNINVKFENISTIPLLWISSLDSLKNWHEALKIFNKLMIKNKRNFEFIFVGGYNSEIDEINRFKTKLYEYNLIGKSIWYPFINYNRIHLLYKLTSLRGGIFLSTSISESFGNTVAEAMASKCPIVASNIDAYNELLDNGKNGFLYDLNNIDDAVFKIEILINDKKIRNEKIENAYNKALKEFDPQKHTEKWLNIITGKNI